MGNEELLNQYKEVRECEYKGLRYLVRDNGAICRLPKEGGRPSKLDNVWTFGTKNKDGYMILTGNIRVHQVVCTAFHGPEPEPHMVVDHIDTNRCNNRPENLRWLTRLENALNNPATRKKIIKHCGSVEAFIADPSILRKKALPTNIAWMRTVSKEEAEKCRRSVERWSQEDKPKCELTGKGIGDFIFSDEEMAEAAQWNGGAPFPGYTSKEQRESEIEESWRQYHEENYGLKDSLTPGAKQLNWKTPTEFLLCPSVGQERTLQAYLNNLVKGQVFIRTKYGDGGVVLDCGINEVENALYVLTQNGDDEEDQRTIKPWALCKIIIQDGYYVHENDGSFFHEDGGRKYFTLAMGKEWTGGEVYDDFCRQSSKQNSELSVPPVSLSNVPGTAPPPQLMHRRRRGTPSPVVWPPSAALEGGAHGWHVCEADVPNNGRDGVEECPPASPGIPKRSHPGGCPLPSAGIVGPLLLSS